MKPILTIGLVLGIFTQAFAQSCQPYFPSKEGVSIEITNYNGKGKKQGRAVHTILSIEETAEAIKMVAQSKNFDKKDEPIGENEYEATCKDGVFELDFSAFFASEALSNYEASGMTITLIQDKLLLPNNLAVGDLLEDANMTASITAGPLPVTLKFFILNRTVEAIETIKVPAGEFEAVKLSYDLEMNLGVSMKVIDWFVKGIGMVRSESFNKSGKRIGYSELTQFSEN